MVLWASLSQDTFFAATAGLIFLSEPIIRLIFERGAFTGMDTIARARGDVDMLYVMMQMSG